MSISLPRLISVLSVLMFSLSAFGDASPIDFSKASLQARCGTDYYQVTDGVEKLLSSVTDTFQALPKNGVYTFGIGGYPGNYDLSVLNVTYSAPENSLPQILIARVPEGITCPNVINSENEFTFKGTQKLSTTLTSVSFQYDATVSSTTNGCGLPSIDIDPIGSEIRYKVTCEIH